MTETIVDTTEEYTDYDSLFIQREFKFRWKGKEYTLREPDGDAAAQYQNMLMASASMSSDGKVQRITGMADSEPVLVSACVFQGNTEKNVLLIHVKKWPSRLVDDLFEKAKEYGEKDKEDKKDPAKNDLGNLTDGSELPESGDIQDQ